MFTYLRPKWCDCSKLNSEWNFSSESIIMKRSTKSCQRRKKLRHNNRKSLNSLAILHLKDAWDSERQQIRDVKRNSLIAMLPVELNFTVRIGFQRGTNWAQHKATRKNSPPSHGWDASPSAGLPPEKSTVRGACLKNTTQRLHRNGQPEVYTLTIRPPYHAITWLTQLRPRQGKKSILVKAHNRTEILPAGKMHALGNTFACMWYISLP